jgi:nitrate/TMAO reductase-like tetraheme cytochrome c subunit
MSKQSAKLHKLVFVLLAMFLFLIVVLHSRFTSEAVGPVVHAVTPTPTPKAKRSRKRKTSEQTGVKYSEFSHNVPQHKLECSSCHTFPTRNWKEVRKSDEAFPDVTDYPQHASCLNCHRQQFFKGAQPLICSICHINPGPRDSSRHSFANPREIFDASKKGQEAVSDFNIYFPHDKHIDIVGGNNANQDARFARVAFTHGNRKKTEGDNCSVCHQTYKPQGDSDDEYFTKPPAKLGDAFWLKKGTFKTSPINHSLCFTCHSQDSGIAPLPSNCAACHKPLAPIQQMSTDFDSALAVKTMNTTDKITLLAWRKRASSGTFRHEWFSHAELSCAVCHNVSRMNTTELHTRKVPIVSCGGGGTGCHITPTSDDGGILNIEIDMRKTDSNYQCVKCHIAYGKAGIPESHIKAIAAMIGK